MEDPKLTVTPVVTGLAAPTGIAFLGPNDFLVIEKNSGQVKRVIDGVVQPQPALDLAVNFFSERGLLGIALHPNFESNGFVYLYWTCRAPSFTQDCAGGTADTDDPPQVSLLGNRVDRFVWNGSTLTMDRNIIRLRSYQADQGQPPRGNHNGGKVLFGPDGKLYIYIGDNGRRGWMQNITEGFGPDGMDDQFGGPETDDAHLTGVVIRLNDDGTTPTDNPFFNAELPPEASDQVRANIQKVFAYGIRNGFGLAFDPATGQLWESQNADDAGSEINRIEAGMNGGWVQIMGLLDFIADYKAIETSPVYFGLQQIRWPPTLIADSPKEALNRLFMLPGARYTDPLLTWKFEIAPAGFGFVGGGLGPEFEGDLIVGGARNFLLDGHLFRLKLSSDRLDLVFDDPRLFDRRANNFDKWDITESESLLFGKGFGIVTDILTGPSGTLFVVGLEKGAVYEICRR
jgi:glucose/arabinose dehydrogenase